MMRISIFSAVVVLMFFSVPGFGLIVEGFRLDQLPPGRSVTLPRPTATLVPLAMNAKLTATSSAQTLKFSSVNLGKGAAPHVQIAIFDPKAPRVKYIEVKADNPVIYVIHGLSTIGIRCKAMVEASSSKTTLVKIESDSPLEVAR